MSYNKRIINLIKQEGEYNRYSFVSFLKHEHLYIKEFEVLSVEIDHKGELFCNLYPYKKGSKGVMTQRVTEELSKPIFDYLIKAIKNKKGL